MASNHQSNNGWTGTVPLSGRSRVLSSWPLLVVAALFVVGAFLTWYFTWFGRELSPVDISTYLADEKHPRKIQHALLQVQQKIDRNDRSARQWYAQLVALANHPETEIRLTAAWVMGSDSASDEFHQTLLKLLQDPEPIVRRNAALALVRFGDSSGRKELQSVLESYPVNVETAGTLSSTLKPEVVVSRGALVARVQPSGAPLEIRSPLPGRVDAVFKQAGDTVQPGEVILSLRSDEDSVWEALRALAIIGRQAELETIRRYLQSHTLEDRLRQQATFSMSAIERRLRAE